MDALTECHVKLSMPQQTEQFLPPDAPLAMPIQSFSDHPGAPQGSLMTSPPGIGKRRALIFSATGLTSAAGVLIVGHALSWKGLTGADLVFLALFSILFTWTTFSFLSFCAGIHVVSARLRRP